VLRASFWNDKGQNIFQKKKDEEPVWFDLKTQMIEELDIKRKNCYYEIVA